MKNIKIFVVGLFLIINLIACDDKNFLAEEPIDFLSPENTFTDPAAFELATANLYFYLRKHVLFSPGNRPYNLGYYTTEISYAYFAHTYDTYRSKWNLVTSLDEVALEQWTALFGLVKLANDIITRAEAPEANWPDESRKKSIIAEAKFFRAFAYRYLAHGFGGVPILEKETTEIMVDLVRASREDVYKFAKSDLEYAVEWLPEEPKQDGRIDKYAAYHVLSEVCISLGEFTEAITAASKVIDNPRYELMTERFGNYKNGIDMPEPHEDIKGNVYWDLFRRGNQDRASGNKEAIFIVNIEFGVQGGLGNNNDGILLEYQCGPWYENTKDPDGKPGMVRDPRLGRPINWNQLTNYVKYDIWASDWSNDIRNSEDNIKRHWVYNNPASAYYGQPVDFNNLSTPIDTLMGGIGPYFTKNSSAFEGNPVGFSWGRTYRDFYVIRLAETYLLRAEAHIGNNDLESAAADINVVRSRAHAKPVASGDVDIDYIFDERARELYMEDWRFYHLMRTGKLAERVRKYNEGVEGISDHNNLLPIPQSEIDRNLGAELKQNPGY